MASSLVLGCPGYIVRADTRASGLTALTSTGTPLTSGPLPRPGVGPGVTRVRRRLRPPRERRTSSSPKRCGWSRDRAWPHDAPDKQRNGWPQMRAATRLSKASSVYRAYIGDFCVGAGDGPTTDQPGQVPAGGYPGYPWRRGGSGQTPVPLPRLRALLSAHICRSFCVPASGASGLLVHHYRSLCARQTLAGGPRGGGATPDHPSTRYGTWPPHHCGSLRHHRHQHHHPQRQLSPAIPKAQR